MWLGNPRLGVQFLSVSPRSRASLWGLGQAAPSQKKRGMVKLVCASSTQETLERVAINQNWLDGMQLLLLLLLTLDYGWKLSSPLGPFPECVLDYWFFPPNCGLGNMSCTAQISVFHLHWKCPRYGIATAKTRRSWTHVYRRLGI